MSRIQKTAFKKGFIPLGGNDNCCISWQGQPLADFWMWNRRFNEGEGGKRTLQTIKVTELKEAAMHYWRDKWVPVEPITEDMLRAMEDALRSHRGLKMEGVKLPDGPFLKMPEPLPNLD